MPARTSLTSLIRAIGRLDSATALEYLDASPALARECLAAGATGGESKSWYFERIGHYAYAGDTALHLAAAAYLPSLVDWVRAPTRTCEIKRFDGAGPGQPHDRSWWQRQDGSSR